MTHEFRLLINGALVGSGAHLDVINPATGQAFAKAPRANASEFGLAGTVWGKDVEAATRVAERINSGTVWVNQHMAIDPDIPFRGARQSGLGGELGEDGLHEYTQAHIVNAVALA